MTSRIRGQLSTLALSFHTQTAKRGLYQGRVSVPKGCPPHQRNGSRGVAREVINTALPNDVGKADQGNAEQDFPATVAILPSMAMVATPITEALRTLELERGRLGEAQAIKPNPRGPKAEAVPTYQDERVGTALTLC